MAARTDTQRLLFGGMQTDAPSDQLAEGNSLFIQNFRSDQNNQLRARNGSYKRAGPVGSGRFHTLYTSGVNEYAGIGKDLFHGIGLTTTVDTGFDGDPLGMASYQKATWVMNRAKQRRLYATESAQWGVEAPASAPVATGGGQLTQSLSDFTGGNVSVKMGVVPDKGETEDIYAMQGGAPVDNDYAEADFSGDGGTLKVKMLTAGSASMYAEDGGTLVVDGQTKDDDVTRVKIWCSNPRAIESMTIFAYSGTTGYVEFAIVDPPKFLNQAMGSWTEVKIRRRLNLDDYASRITAAAPGPGRSRTIQTSGSSTSISDLESQFATAIQTPTFVYTGSGWPQTGIGGAPPASYPPSDAMLNFDWGGVTKFGVSFKCKEPVSVGLGAVEEIGTVGENSSGAISYWVSFGTIYGEDGNPSPASNAVIAGNQTISLSGVPTSSNSKVIVRYVYRMGGGLTQAYRVGTIYDNVTTTWEDHTSNRDAQAQGIIMPINRDLPPACRGVAGPIYGKMIVFGSDDHPARYWWTDAGIPWAFPGSGDDAVGNWEDAGADDDMIVALRDHRPVTAIYKQRSIWRLVGDPATNSPEKTSSHVGVFGPRAVCSGGGVDYIVGPEGVFMFNMDYETKLSQAIDGIFKGDYVQLYGGTILFPITLDHPETTSIELVGDRLRVSYAEHGYAEPNVVLLYDLTRKRWFREEYTNLAAKAPTAMLNENSPGSMGSFMAGFTGSDGGYYYQLEAVGWSFDDFQSARAIWQSRFQNQGLPYNNKVYLDVEVEAQTLLGSSKNSPMDVYVVFDNGSPLLIGSLSSTSTDTPMITKVFRIMNEAGDEVGRTAKNIAIRIECDLWGPVIIKGVAIRWYPEERVARSFDSGPTALGVPEKVKQVDHVEYFMTASGQALLQNFHSDLPGNLLTSRDSSDFNAPNGRGTYKRRLDDIVEGRNFRLTLSDSPSGSTYQVHQARVRMRPIGEYLDGSRGEYFESPEFSVAPGRVGELGDFLLDYDTASAGGRIEIWSDLPANVMAVRRVLPIPARNRAPFVFNLNDPQLVAPSDSKTIMPYGQLFKVRIYPPPGGVLRLHGRAVLRGRIIGVYVDGSNGEAWETQPLDLLGGMGLIREVCIVSETAGPMTLEISCSEARDRPVTVRARVPFDTSITGRVPVHSRVPGTTKGHLQQFRVVGPYVARLLEIKAYMRRTESADTGWEWVSVPVEATANAWAQINVPMDSTPEGFAWVDIPVDTIE